MEIASKIGYFVGNQSNTGLLTIGGKCPLKGAISPNTDLNLTQFASLKLGNKSIDIKGWPQNELHFLYSWTCNIHLNKFSYKYVNDEIKIVEYSKGYEHDENFPYRNYPILFDPIRFDLQKISENDQAIILKLNYPDTDPDYKFQNKITSKLATPSHQFGGVPYLISNDLEEIKCPQCMKAMKLVASIGNESYSDNEGFSGNSFVQVLYWICTNCYVVSAQNYCD